MTDNAESLRQRIREDAAAGYRILDHLPDLLRNERTRRGLTQCAAADEVGVGYAEWCHYERRRKQPSLETTLRLLFWLNKSLGEEHR